MLAFHPHGEEGVVKVTSKLHGLSVSLGVVTEALPQTWALESEHRKTFLPAMYFILLLGTTLNTPELV